MSNPEDLLYSASHEWAKVSGDEAVLGITHFAQESLGDITYVIYSFLTGEATLRFLLKAAVVACVSGAVFWFYLRDIEEQADER